MSDENSSVSAPSAPHRATVAVGATVRLRDADGEYEHTIVARLTAGAPLTCISAGSPVGRALLGRRTGELVEVRTPDGIRPLTIVEVIPAQVAPPRRDSPKRAE